MHVTPEIVVGFHGCDKTVFNKVIKRGEGLKESVNNYDWLGHGMYFWEGSYDRALEWAKNSNTVKTPAVIGAFIKLGNCLELLDIKDLAKVKVAHELLVQECMALGKALPSNKAKVNGIDMSRELDCDVMLRLQQFNNEAIATELGLPNTEGSNKREIQHHPQFIDSVRGMFPEGEELYEGAGFRAKNHIQLCVINPNCVIGYFDPKNRTNSWYKKI